MLRKPSIMFIFLLSGCHPIHGIIESEFKLSSESQLPVWAHMFTDTESPTNLTIKLTYYTPILPFVSNTVLTVERDGDEIYSESGQHEWHPQYLAWAQEDWPARAHPSYVLVTIEGATEVIEHKKMAPIFYISNEGIVQRTIGNAE